MLGGAAVGVIDCKNLLFSPYLASAAVPNTATVANKATLSLYMVELLNIINSLRIFYLIQHSRIKRDKNLKPEPI